LTVGIDTFVGPGDLFPNQKLIHDKLVDIGDTFFGQFRAARTGIMRGSPDTRMLARFGPNEQTVSLDDQRAIGAAMASFFETAEWGRQSEAHSRRATVLRRRALH
jgi:hypothetical protein